MEFLTQLWLPILLAAVFVFLVSSIFHMAIPIHKNDHRKMPGEDEILALMREKGVGPAQYMFPNAESMKEMATPEMKKKWEQGPIGILRVMTPGDFNMGKNLGLWYLYCAVVGLFAAFAAWHGVGGASDEYVPVFRLVATVAIAAYSVASVVDSIWKGQAWSITAKFVLEGVVYGLVTAGTFAWLWPNATPSA
jgi:hypothetical protein